MDIFIENNFLLKYIPKRTKLLYEDIMLELLRSKFAPNSDIANKLVTTSGKSLAEAGQSDTYSIGMFISHKDVFKTDKWAKNLLGKLLMKVRQELI